MLAITLKESRMRHSNSPEIREKPSLGVSLEVGEEGLVPRLWGAMACMDPAQGEH